MTAAVASLPPRFAAKVNVESNGCWTWTGARNDKGYGTVGVDGSTVSAHRFAYLTLRADVPQSLDLDHLCRNRACVNPEHLEPVSHRENILRGTSPAALNAVKTTCLRGHPFDDANTYTRPDGRRVCISCRKETDSRRPRATKTKEPS